MDLRSHLDLWRVADQESMYLDFGLQLGREIKVSTVLPT